MSTGSPTWISTPRIWRCSAGTRTLRSWPRSRRRWRGPRSSCCRPWRRWRWPRSSPAAIRFRSGSSPCRPPRPTPRSSGWPGAVTGREVIVLFQGHYHGHFEEGLVDLSDGRAGPVQRGLSRGVTGRVRIAQFNDPDTLRRALEPGDVALVLTEPAMSNNLHMLLPEPGWHAALRDLTRRYGTLLALDETHTHVVGPGGASGLWQLEPDIVTIGKAVAGGLPMGAYGVTAELGEQLDAARNVATGGTLFGNPLSAAAAKAALTEVLVPDAYAHTSALGSQLADGIEQAIGSAGLPWTVIRLGPRAGQWYGPMPRTGAQAHALTDSLLTRLIRVWLANRGVWEALPGAGPTTAVPATSTDVARYVNAYGELLAQLR